MSIRTILALVIVILLTILIMQNTDEVKFTIFFADAYISKVAIMTAMSVSGFILGLLVAWPKNKKYDIEEYHDNVHRKDDRDTLSDEDRDYIS